MIWLSAGVITVLVLLIIVLYLHWDTMRQRVETALAEIDSLRAHLAAAESDAQERKAWSAHRKEQLDKQLVSELVDKFWIHAPGLKKHAPDTDIDSLVWHVVHEVRAHDAKGIR